MKQELLKSAVVVGMMAASAGVWYWAFKRWYSARPLVPLARRRPVPWLGRDVLFIALLAFLLPGLALRAVDKIAGTKAADEIARTKPAGDESKQAKTETAHPAEQLLRSRDWRMMAVATFMAVFLAPLFEELFFRVVLQGWLETVWSRQRRKNRALRTGPLSWTPLVLPATFFALMHLRFGREPPTPQYLNALFIAHLVRIGAEVATIGLVIAVLRLGVGATAADLGWQPRKLAADAKLAFLALIAAMPPIVLLQGLLLTAVKLGGIEIAPDPAPLFLLALVFGYLYQRTHRIMPSLLLHAAFNATSILVFFLADRS